MIRISTLISLLFIAFYCQAQTRTISGVLTDSQGEPLPGVNIVVKGTTNGTITDMNGAYNLEAPIGGILVFSSIGFTSYEVVVNEQTISRLKSKNQPKEKKNRNDQNSLVPRTEAIPWAPAAKNKRIAKMTDSNPSYILQDPNNKNRSVPLKSWPNNVYKVKYLKPSKAIRRYGNQGNYGLFLVKQGDYSRGKPKVSLGTTYLLEQVTALPDLQNAFSQGRPENGLNHWQGPETGNVFSWGPALSTLEYDGGNYPFNKNGRLISIGSNLGLPAEAFNPYAIFKNGHTWVQKVSIEQVWKRNEILFSWLGKSRQGVIPNFQSRDQQVNLKFKSHLPDQSNFGLFFNYGRSHGNLVERGANLSQIFYAIATTPASFDNANEFTHPEKFMEAYQLENGTARSYSPGAVDNPYGLINQNSDREELQKFQSYITWEKDLMDPLTLKYRASFDLSNSDNRFGLLPFSAGSVDGRSTFRREHDQMWQSNLGLNYHTYFDYSNLDFKASLHHNFTYEKVDLDRVDGSGLPSNSVDVSLADKVTQLNYQRQRSTHEVTGSALLEYNNIISLSLANRSYLSSTTKDHLWLPAAGVSFIFSEIPYWSSNFLSYGKLHSSWSASVRERPLIVTQRSFNSLTYTLPELTAYFEDQELPTSSILKPEQIRQYELGIELDLFNSHLDVDASYFRKTTLDALVPTAFRDGAFNLINRAKLLSRGFEIALGFALYRRAPDWRTSINFTRNKFETVDLADGYESLPIAGFSEVNRSLIAGEPYGVITGTRYQRGPQGNLLIGLDGFPLVDPEPGVIGDPNPDWTMGFSHYFTWHKFNLAIVMEASFGAEIWNGTRNTLNYLGASQLTADQRGTSNFIFPGIHSDGRINLVTVDFANPVNGLSGNRWARYGWSGVGEDAIEDGSWFRLSEVRLGYDLTNLLKPFVKFREITISTTAKNLLLLTKYSGIDPNTHLFGYDAGAGLDYFNFPHTRSLEMSLSVKF